MNAGRENYMRKATMLLAAALFAVVASPKTANVNLCFYFAMGVF